MSHPRTAAGLALPDPVGDRPGPRGPLGYLLAALRLRPGGKRTLSVISGLLFLAGGGLFSFPLVTDIYAEQVIQTQLAEEFQQSDFQQAYAETADGADDAVEAGDPLTRIAIPAIGVEALVVEGTNMAALRAGAGHYPNTPLPGEDGNVAIAGHRTTYGKPFNRLNELSPGDEVRLETPLAIHVYEVVGPPGDHKGRPCSGPAACWITSPADWSVIEPTEQPALTLTTCHPKGSARQRLIVRAELVETLDPGEDPDGA